MKGVLLGCASQEVTELGGQVEAVAAATMTLRERHQGDVSISVAATQILLGGTNGNNAGQEEEEAALKLARDEQLMQALSKVCVQFSREVKCPDSAPEYRMYIGTNFR